MAEWTQEKYTEARVWADQRGAKSRILEEALDEISRLEVENAVLKQVAESPCEGECSC